MQAASVLPLESGAAEGSLHLARTVATAPGQTNVAGDSMPGLPLLAAQAASVATPTYISVSRIRDTHAIGSAADFTRNEPAHIEQDDDEAVDLQASLSTSAATNAGPDRLSAQRGFDTAADSQLVPASNPEALPGAGAPSASGSQIPSSVPGSASALITSMLSAMGGANEAAGAMSAQGSARPGHAMASATRNSQSDPASFPVVGISLAAESTPGHVAVVSGAASAAQFFGDSSSKANSGGSATDAFNVIDSGTPAATWLHAGVHQAEAGFEDPALGWVSVRAGLAGSEVHASLVPGSVDAAVVLGGHLPELNSYLAERHSEVSAVSLAAPDARNGDSAMSFGAHANAQQGGGSHSANTGTPGDPSRSMDPGRIDSVDSKANHRSVAAADSRVTLDGASDATQSGNRFAAMGSLGIHISVVA
jgi:hypothetical protein